MQNAFAKIPQSLKALPNWVLWKLEHRDGKLTKVPYQVNGRRASTTNHMTWNTFDEVLRQFANGGYNGVGFVFSRELNMCGVDIDNCRDPETGVIDARALGIIKELSSYTEISQSGKGVHILVEGTWPYPRNRKGGVEVYNHERYFIVTGNQLPESTITLRERQAELKWLYETHLNGDRPKAPQPKTEHVSTLEDDDIVRRCRKAANSAKFEALYDNGDTTEYDNDESRADSALCCMFAFWTRDFAQVDRLFRCSKLYRPKWEREDYRRRTIERALELVTEFYSGNDQGVAKEQFQNESQDESLSTDPLQDWRSRIVSFDALLRTPPTPVSPILPGLFDAGDKVVIIGPSKVRKSFFAMQLAICLATGREFLNRIPTSSRRVLVVQLEVQSNHYHWRVVNMCKSMFIEPARIDDRILALNARGIKITFDKLALLAKEHRADVIIIDPFYKIADGDENSAEDLKRVLKSLDAIAESTGAAIVYVHHDKKGYAGDLQASDRGSGSGVLGRDFDSSIVLTPQQDNASEIVVEFLTRNYPPKEPICIEFGNGVFLSSDSAALKQTSQSGKRKQKFPLETWVAMGRGLFEFEHKMPVSVFLFKLGELGANRQQQATVRDALMSEGFVGIEYEKGTKHNGKKFLVKKDDVPF